MIVNYIQKLPQDKKDHYILGIFYSLYILAGVLIFGNLGAHIGFSLALISVLYKELYNDWYKKKGSPEIMDFIVNMVSPTTTYIAFLCAIYLIK